VAQLPPHVFHIRQATVKRLQESLDQDLPLAKITLHPKTVWPAQGVQMEELDLSQDTAIAMYVRGFLAGLQNGRKGF
jgi:hypothetical protein